jgi:hypothetical protein
MVDTALDLAQRLLRVLPADANPRLRSELRSFVKDMGLSQILYDSCLRGVPAEKRDAVIAATEILGAVYDGTALGDKLMVAADMTRRHEQQLAENNSIPHVQVRNLSAIDLEMDR